MSSLVSAFGRTRHLGSGGTGGTAPKNRIYIAHPCNLLSDVVVEAFQHAKRLFIIMTIVTPRLAHDQTLRMNNIEVAMLAGSRLRS